MKVLVAGDFCSRYRTANIIEGCYDEALGSVRKITENSDYSIVNLECPIINGLSSPIIKQGPNLAGSDRMVDAIKYMGFGCVTLANNHFYDQGDKGVHDTIEALKKQGVDYVGGGFNLNEASKILYKEINGERLAIVNCCEHEFSIATEKTGGANPLNPVMQYYAIREAKANADYVLVIVHGGHEHYQLPSPRMVETYRFFVDDGADAVVNHHQHCYSGYEVYNGKPIFYGIGNLFFDMETPVFDKPWNYGYLVLLELSKDGVSYTYHPYKQCAEEPMITLLDQSSFDETLNSLNRTISDKEKLQEATNKYYHTEMIGVECFLNPYQKRFVRALVKIGVLPSLFKKQWLLKMQNYIECESHRDKVEYYLNNKRK